MKKLQNITSIIFAFFLFSQTFGQEVKTMDFFSQIKNYDLSTILMADKFLAEDNENEKEYIKRAEMLGFIGNDYQRFFIHFVSVIQNPANPMEYFAYGKTKVKETIRTFQGTIIIKQAETYTIVDWPEYKEGFAICDLILYEDNKQSSTGFIKGSVKSEFLIDSKGKFRYDATSFGADGFSNNQFIGSWTNYKTNITKKCNWGDYRIPECEWNNGCDIGAGEFSISERFVKNGWENYKSAYTVEPDKSEAKKAKQKENEKWWK